MIALVGCGYWGPSFARLANQEGLLKYVVDLDQNRLEKMKGKYPSVLSTTNYYEAFKDEEVKAVIVATPASSHHKIAMDAMQAGKHVLIEKPMAISSEQCEDLIRLSKEKNRTLMVGHTFEYNPAVRKLKELIDEELGDIYYIYSTRVNLGQIRGDVNALWNLAPHDISICNYLIGGQPITIRAEGKTYLQKGMEDVVFLYLEYANNVIVQIHVSWLDPNKVRKTVVVGSKKMAIFNDLNENKVEILDRGAEFDDEDARYTGGTFKLRYGSSKTPEIEKSEPLKNEFDHFVDCYKNKKKPLTDGQAGLNVVKILEAAQKSLKQNGIRVHLNK